MDKELSCYRRRKEYVGDLKVGAKFYDTKDKCFYEVTSISIDEVTVKALIETNPVNSRKNGVIRRSPYEKVTVREFKF